MRTIGKSPSLPNLHTHESFSESPEVRRKSPEGDKDLFEAKPRANRNLTPAPARKAELDEDAIQKMILGKGEKWNDAETRRAFLRADLTDRLIDAMNKVPAIEQEAAREALAKDAISYFGENSGFPVDVDDSPFLQERIGLFWTLFGERGKDLYETGVTGSLDLDAPEEYAGQVRDALVNVEIFAIAQKMDALFQFE